MSEVVQPETIVWGGRTLRVHRLKIWPVFFTAVVRGVKTYEVRLSDRAFRAGDIVRLEEWDPKTQDYTGSYALCEITFVTTATDWEMIPNHLSIFGFELKEISRLRGGMRILEPLP